MEEAFFIIGFVLLPVGIHYAIVKIFKKKDTDNSELSFVEIDNTSTTKKINNDDTNDSLLNPVSGGLMMGGIGGIDTFGNSFGSDTCGGFND